MLLSIVNVLELDSTTILEEADIGYGRSRAWPILKDTLEPRDSFGQQDKEQHRKNPGYNTRGNGKLRINALAAPATQLRDEPKNSHESRNPKKYGASNCHQ